MTNIINNINVDILAKAMEMNKTEADRIISANQQMWDDGHSFTATDMASLFCGAQRSGSNDEEEMNAAVKSTEADLIYKIIIKTWAENMSRADAVVICNKLFETAASIQFFGETLTASDVARSWSAEHTNEEPICMTTRAIEDVYGTI